MQMPLMQAQHGPPAFLHFFLPFLPRWQRCPAQAAASAAAEDVRAGATYAVPASAAARRRSASRLIRSRAFTVRDRVSPAGRPRRSAGRAGSTVSRM
jgi:hypothetical protein